VSRRARIGLLGSAALVAAVLALVTVTLRAAPAGRGREARHPVRELVLSARGVAFAEVNPTLEFRAGETVRIVVRNDDDGVTHSFALPGLDPQVTVLAPGESVAYEITPDAPGTFEYVCPLHLPLMKGRVEVTPRAGS